MWRYSSIPISVPENVADHSYWVALYSVLIHGEVMAQSPGGVRARYARPAVLAAILLKAVSHDVEESVTGDVVRPFKYSLPKLKEAIDEAEAKMADELLPARILDVPRQAEALAGDAMVYVNAVVKAADFMSLYQFMRREVLRGNCEIRDFVGQMEGDVSAKCNAKSQTWPFDILSLYYRELEKSARDLHLMSRSMRGEIR